MVENQEKTILQENFNGLNLNDLINPVKDQDRVIKIIDSVEKMMAVYAEVFTYTQMRNIYGIVTSAGNVSNLHRLRPRIAYIQARQEGRDAKKFVEFIIELMKVVNDEMQREEFIKFMETMVAYHKLYGKNKN